MVAGSLRMSSVYELVKAYGLWVLFIGITLESMGIPVPGETALVLAALYAGTHRLTIGLVSIVAATASTVVIGYLSAVGSAFACWSATANMSGSMSAVSRSVSTSFIDMGARSPSLDGSLIYCGSLPPRRCQPHELVVLPIYDCPRRNLLGSPVRRGRLFV